MRATRSEKISNALSKLSDLFGQFLTAKKNLINSNSLEVSEIFEWITSCHYYYASGISEHTDHPWHYHQIINGLLSYKM